MAILGDAFKRAVPGAPVRIPARWFNAVSDLIRPPNSAPAVAPDRGARPTVRIYNGTGAKVSRFGILGIADLVVTPDLSLGDFQNNWVLTGRVPTVGDMGSFVICADQIADKAIGSAFLFGACPVQINFIGADDEFADVTIGDSTKLTSGSSGGAQVLWSPSLTGVQWALVRVGGGSGGGGFTSGIGQFQGQVLTMVDDHHAAWEFPQGDAS